MNNREEFETLFLILYKKWKGWDKQTCAYGVGWDIWQEQQKIIDKLKAENKELLEIIERCNGGECYQCDDYNMPRQLMKQIRELEVEIERMRQAGARR